MKALWRLQRIRIPASEIPRYMSYISLPRRYVEVDVPYTLFDGNYGRQACWPRMSTQMNARKPSVSSESSEALQKVVERGFYKELFYNTSLKKAWIQPKTDLMLHLNWTRKRSAAYYGIYNAFEPPIDWTPIKDTIEWARQYRMGPSFTGDLIHYFDLKTLVASLDNDTDASREVKEEEEEEDPATLALPTAYEKGKILQAHEWWGFHHWELAHDLHELVTLMQGQTLRLTIVGIALHVNKKIALKSYLFDSYGDAAVQLVDYNDLVQLRKFYDIYLSDDNVRRSEPYVRKLFKVVRSRQFRQAVFAWKKRVTWLLQSAVWRRLKIDKPETFDGDPGLVWKPPIPPTQTKMRIGEHVPDLDNPWWAQHAEEVTPKVNPQVMIRLCPNECYLEKNLPDEFGELWYDDSGLEV